MHSITIYIDETLSTREIIRLKHEILAIPHVTDVEHPRHDPHDLTVDYEAHSSLPGLVLIGINQIFWKPRPLWGGVLLSSKNEKEFFVLIYLMSIIHKA